MLIWVAGAVGVIGLAVFLGHYAVTVNSVPLWIILVAAVAMAGYDVVSTQRARRNEDTGNGGDDST